MATMENLPPIDHELRFLVEGAQVGAFRAIEALIFAGIRIGMYRCHVEGNLADVHVRTDDPTKARRVLARVTDVILDPHEATSGPLSPSARSRRASPEG